MCEASLPSLSSSWWTLILKQIPLPFISKILLTIIAHVRLFSQNYIANLPECRFCVCVMVSLVARSHSLFVFFIIYCTFIQDQFVHTHSFITFVEFRSSFFIAASSGRGSPLGCRAEIRTRGRLTAARHATNWAMPHPTEPCVMVSLPAPTLVVPCQSVAPGVPYQSPDKLWNCEIARPTVPAIEPPLCARWPPPSQALLVWKHPSDKCGPAGSYSALHHTVCKFMLVKTHNQILMYRYYLPEINILCLRWCWTRPPARRCGWRACRPTPGSSSIPTRWASTGWPTGRRSWGDCARQLRTCRSPIWTGNSSSSSFASSR